MLYWSKGGSAVYFLIDYENVGGLGLRGSEYLLPSDYVILFYSSQSPNIEHRHWENICRSGCGFEAYSLFKQRKNGLDFYIATKVGELFGADRTRHAVVVSKDSGFQALQDFWQSRSGTPHRIGLGETIEQGILVFSENTPRFSTILSLRKMDNISKSYAAMQAERKQKEVLSAALESTPYADRLTDIHDLLKTGLPPKRLYPEALHRFGRADGLAIYHILRELPQKS